ncbi:hypothetical protein GCM10022393_37740 [Aquimarina addita]|uniref:Peptidase M56 domain-containing protein n=1 Tax=Aquimarina addita TaxID=870485 RepID=A0ABP6URV6_9FLAO
MPVVVNKYLIGKRFAGIALWPFIVVKNDRLKDDKAFINHEKIHLRQQIELLILPFYFFYIVEYFVRLLQYKNSQDAYRNISFEREAYEREEELMYLTHRKLWSFIKYL